MNKKILTMFGMFLLVLSMFPLISSAQDPTIITKEPVEVNSKFATISGEITDLGSETELNTSFRYKTENQENWTYTDFKLKDSTGVFHYTIKNLSSSTTYEYEFLADYNGDRVKGGILTFETEPKETIFYIDYDKKTNVTILIILLILAGILFILGYPEFTSVIFLFSGFSLLLSGINAVIGFIIISLGVLSAFMKGGNN